MARLTKRQMYERERSIHAMIRRGASVNTIEEKLSKKYECAKSTIRAQYNKVMTDLIEANKEALPELKANLMERANFIFEKALENDNLKTALETINLQAKIGGVYNKSDKAEDKTPEFITIGKKTENITPISDAKKSTNE